jgi:hypothetical protein
MRTRLDVTFIRSLPLFFTLAPALGYDPKSAVINTSVFIPQLPWGLNSNFCVNSQ